LAIDDYEGAFTIEATGSLVTTLARGLVLLRGWPR
jgi:hypothetical protein